jgi:UDP-sugar transporter A1/2/3
MKEEKQTELPELQTDGQDEEYSSLLVPDGQAETTGRSAKVRASFRKQPAHALSPAAPGKARRRKETPSRQALMIKYTALLLLVAQMVGLVLLMRYSRTQHNNNNDADPQPQQPMYLASTAVFLMEVVKLVVCLVIVGLQARGLGSSLGAELSQHVLHAPREIFKLTLPSVLYTIQNNLLYLALTNLDAATYQVCYQLKILTTALFSALLLQRKFSSKKWLALVVLTTGVAVVQISGSGDQHSAHGAGTAAAAGESSQNRVVGLVAVLCAACTSGFSGVYFERILKGSVTSLWIRNVQMGLPSVVIAYCTVYVKDSAAIQTQGFLGGYSPLVWTVVLVQAVGGLIVATVVKYADNVLKVFATSFSIVLSCLISAFLFDFHPSWMFLSGASLVVTATVMYSSPERKVRRGGRK